MADPNISEVFLLHTPLENDYRHTLYFPDKATQESHFMSLVKKRYTDFSYQRKDGYIRVPAGYDEVVAMGVNYVMYRNKAYSNKWFYAFITNIEYKDDGRTDIFIETDVMQTWMFNYIVEPSYIEREHCFNDTPGVNTQPEDLETGEYVTNSVVKNQELTSCYILIGSTVNPYADKIQAPGSDNLQPDIYPSVTGGVYGGVFSGLKYYIAKTPVDATNFVRKLDATGQGDAVVSMFMYPSALCKGGDKTLVETEVPVYLYWGDGSQLIKRATSLQGYTPRNNKLLTYPYTYLMVANNGGNEVNYHYELFDYNKSDLTKQVCRFVIYGTVAAGGSIRLVPLKYGGEDENVLKGLTAAKYPICSWANDVYINWLTQNGMNLDIAKERGQIAYRSGGLTQTSAAINGGLGFIGNAVSGNALGTIGSVASAGLGIAQGGLQKENGLLDIKSVAAQKFQQSMNPPESKGTANAGDVIYAMDMSTFTAHQMSIKQEYAKIIDRYFDMYGYATNLVKEPYKNHRESYWFTKTIACNVDGAIPNKDLNIIKRCYNNGITFWRHTAFVGDYNQSNEIC